jgi:FMN phosphatase YigB (HAD superfamily)
LRPASPLLRQTLLRCPLPMAIVSDRGGIEAKLRHLQLNDVSWRACVAAADTGALKPHPRVLTDVASTLSVPSHALLHLGDRDDTDGAGARHVGAQFVCCPGPGAVIAVVASAQTR